jgi:hypothetical protein
LLPKASVFSSAVRLKYTEEGDIAGGWRKLANEERHSLYFSPDVIRMIEFRRTRWIGCVALTGEEKCMRGLGGKSRRNETSRKSYT